MHDNKMDVTQANRRPSIKAPNDSFRNHHFISQQSRPQQTDETSCYNEEIFKFSFDELDASTSINNFSQCSI
jgi:hypothetical protein